VIFPRNYRQDVNRFRVHFEPLGTGSARTVFALGEQYVIKVPNRPEGVIANRYEAKAYDEMRQRARRRGVSVRSICNLAICELVRLFETRVLVMERVERARYATSKEHRWLKHTDRDQVGVTADGQLVLFDYGG
jgi:hypothetical protein